jgi:hypothetical protein
MNEIMHEKTHVLCIFMFLKKVLKCILMNYIHNEQLETIDS